MSTANCPFAGTCHCTGPACRRGHHCNDHNDGCHLNCTAPKRNPQP